MGAQSSPWIVACDGSNPKFPFGFACLRCGVKSSPPSPAPLEVYLAVAREFQAKHVVCQVPGGRSPS